MKARKNAMRVSSAMGSICLRQKQTVQQGNNLSQTDGKGILSSNSAAVSVAFPKGYTYTGFCGEEFRELF